MRLHIEHILGFHDLHGLVHVPAVPSVEESHALAVPAPSRPRDQVVVTGVGARGYEDSVLRDARKALRVALAGLAGDGVVVQAPPPPST